MAFGFCVMLLMRMAAMPIEAKTHDYIVEDGEEIPIPVAYNLSDTYRMFSTFGVLKNPQDLFIAKDQSIYIADTGNNRILKLGDDGRAIGEFKAEDAGGLNAPEGVFVNENGDIYIADTENMRILKLSANGSVIKEFNKPETAILGESFNFLPRKIAVGTTGMMYILCKTEAQGLLSMDETGAFRGYAATEKVGFNLTDFLIRLVGSAQQKKMIAKRLPSPVSNFLVQNNVIYAVLGNAKSDQISVYNSIGKNLYPSGNFGEGGFLNDITVSSEGIVTVLDSNNCRIFQYDKNGSNLDVFGDKGERKGEFLQPVGIDTNQEGDLFILDAGKNSIQVFKPTYFISLVHSALNYYSSGAYDKAAAEWDNVLMVDESYTLAHEGIAQALYKRGDWKSAANRFEYIGDKAGYSRAYSEYIHDFYREYFGVIVLVFACLVVFGYKLIKKLKGIADRYQ